MRDARAELTATLETLQGYAETLGKPLSDYLDVDALYKETGIEPSTIEALLDGQDVPEDDLQIRASARFKVALEYRRDQNGQRYSLKDVAASYGASANALSPLNNGKGLPGATAIEALEEFFGVAPGYFHVKNAVALNQALDPVRELLKTEVISTANTRVSFRAVDPTLGDTLGQLPLEQQKALNGLIASMIVHNKTRKT